MDGPNLAHMIHAVIVQKVCFTLNSGNNSSQFGKAACSAFLQQLIRPPMSRLGHEAVIHI